MLIKKRMKASSFEAKIVSNGIKTTLRNKNKKRYFSCLNFNINFLFIILSKELWNFFHLCLQHISAR
jgi:hypothetical protein